MLRSNEHPRSTIMPALVAAIPLRRDGRAFGGAGFKPALRTPGNAHLSGMAKASHDGDRPCDTHSTRAGKWFKLRQFSTANQNKAKQSKTGAHHAWKIADEDDRRRRPRLCDALERGGRDQTHDRDLCGRDPPAGL